MKKGMSLTVSALVAAISISACGGGGGGSGGNTTPTTPATPADKSFSVRFASVAGSTPVNCGSTIANVGTTNASAMLKDMRFYLANVKLVRKDGTQVPLVLGANDDWNATIGSDRVTLIDLEDKTGLCAGTTATNDTITGTAPAWSDYTGLVVTLGVPTSMNHTNQGADLSVTPAAINNGVHPGMAWTWQGGRKFTKIELTDAGLAAAPASPTWTAPVFMVHLGSTGCIWKKDGSGANIVGELDSCERPNRLETITFDSFDPATQHIAFDVLAMLANNDATKNSGSAPGCMSAANDPECNAVFETFGLDLVTGQQLTTTKQSVLKVVNNAAVVK